MCLIWIKPLGIMQSASHQLPVWMLSFPGIAKRSFRWTLSFTLLYSPHLLQIIFHIKWKYLWSFRC